MFKAALAIAVSSVVALGGYTFYSYHVQDTETCVHTSNKATIAQNADLTSNILTALGGGSGTSKSVSSKTEASSAKSQNPAPQQPQAEDNMRCERPNPDGSNPEQGGKDPKKVGCKCARKCEKGKPTENYADINHRCKVHCKPDHCDCPNPCES